MLRNIVNPFFARFLVLGVLVAGLIFGVGLVPSAISTTAQLGLRANSGTRPAAPDSGQKIVIGANLVDVAVSVSDSRGRFVPGLTRDEFQVFDNGVKQQVTHFSDLDAPISIGIVYDISGSMDRSINRSVQALARFIETSHDQDDFFLVTFAGRAAIAQDLSRGDPGTMLNQLASVRPSGQTALYDAVLLALEQVKQGPHARRALLVISDGRDNHSDHTFSDLRAAVRESGVIIYAVGITANSNDRQPDVGRLVLTQIAESSGGRAFFPVPYDEASTAQDCARIALELRHQYSLGFYPTDTPGTTRYHRIRVKLDAPKDLGRISLSYRTTYPSFKSPDIGKALDSPAAHPQAQ